MSAQTIGSKYKSIEFLAFSPQGRTFKVVSEDDDDKSIKIGKALRVSLVAEAAREAEKLRQMSHRNIVPILEQFMDENILWIISDYCNGGSLADKIKLKKQANHQPFNKQEIVSMFVQIMQGVSYIHERRLVHRNIKPGNIFISCGTTIKMGDFGIAYQFNPLPVMTKRSEAVVYVSPEILKGENFTAATDLWSCGCVLYELCCLKPPFQIGEFLEISNTIQSGARPSLEFHYGGTFQEPYESLVCLDPQERISAESFLERFFTTEYRHHHQPMKTVLLVGRTGVGKSSLGNLLLGTNVFETSDGMASCTQTHNVQQSTDGVTIVDTVGLADPNLTDVEMREKLMASLEATEDGFDLIFLIMDFGTLASDVFNMLMSTFGVQCKQQLCMVFTKCPSKYVYGSSRELLIERHAYIQNCLKGVSQSVKMFSEVLNASQSVIFIDNPPTNEIPRLEDKFKDIRAQCRSTVLEFIRDSEYGKFTYEMAVQKQEEEQGKRCMENCEMNASFAMESKEKLEIARQTISTTFVVKSDFWKPETLVSSSKSRQDEYTSNDKSIRLTRQLTQRASRLKSNTVDGFRNTAVHEMVCLRNSCWTWNDLKFKDVTDETQIWKSHQKACQTCSKCSFCASNSSSAT